MTKQIDYESDAGKTSCKNIMFLLSIKKRSSQIRQEWVKLKVLALRVSSPLRSSNVNNLHKYM